MGEEAWQRCGPAEADPSSWGLQGGNSTPAVVPSWGQGLGLLYPHHLVMAAGRLPREGALAPRCFQARQGHPGAVSSPGTGGAEA